MSARKRILFVDDEARILAGLRRMLRSMRAEWDMAFANSGVEALAMMAETPFDIVMTDMRMPGMNGVQLLRRVMRQYPRAIRIVLSGQTDREAILSAVGPIHQYLSKPCDLETLKTTLKRACALDALLPNVELKQLIAQMETLPSLPVLYDEVMAGLQSFEATAGTIGELISRDMGMSVKVLQLVNSAFFGLRPHIPDPAQAVIVLGLDTIKILGLSAQAFTQFDQTQLEALSLGSLWAHSLAVGTFARRIAEVEGAERHVVDYAFIAGLLHDVGKLALAVLVPELYGLARTRAREEGIGLLRAEFDLLGTTHAEVGAYLLGLWGLPEPVVEALAFAHRPAWHPSEAFTPITAVHVANILEHTLYPGEDYQADVAVDEAYLARLGLMNRLPVWRAVCEEAWQCH